MSRTSSTCEPLERRTLLAALVPATVTVRVFNDRNRNGGRNSNELFIADYALTATLLTASDGTRRSESKLTNASGVATFTDYVDPAISEVAFARVTLAPNARFYGTSRPTTAAGITADARPSFDFAISDVGPVTGKLSDQYNISANEAVSSPLVDRIVFDDTDRDGKRDVEEQFARTDLAGEWRMNLRSGGHIIRADPGKGFTAAGTDKLVQSVSIRLGPLGSQTVRTFAVTLAQPTVINVLIGYTPAAATTAKDLASKPIRDYIRDLMTTANEVFANSQTNTRLRLVAAQQTAYAEAGDLNTDLDRLAAENDGHMDELITRRELLRADVVCLLISGDNVFDDTVGLAFEYDKDDPAPADDLAFSTIALYSADDDGFTLAHEIGHNLGAGHDIANSRGDTLPAPYAHGYRFRGTDGKFYKDVMAYGDATTLPFFSTPLYSHAGFPIGRADNANNARIVGEIAPVVAKYR